MGRRLALPARLPAFAFALCVGLGAATPGGAAAPGPGPPAPLDAGRLRIALLGLRSLGSVLYVGAHPDDENAAFLAWLVHRRLVEAHYVSLTRGEGGQNRIGSEQGALLGVLRTQELLQARAVDGAEQHFTRAIDLGYSKRPEEALAQWGHQEVLGDLVRVLREVRPDIVVTRFSETQGGHGHHLASAILAAEAFQAASDPACFPEQLAQGLEPFTPRRLFFNLLDLLDGEGAGAEPPRGPVVPIDLGAWNPLLGESYQEMAARAASLNRTQAFGRAPGRGRHVDRFELRAGEPLPPGATDLLDGIDTSWERVRGAKGLDDLLARAADGLDPAAPWRILPLLLEARGHLLELPPGPRVERKRRDLDELVRQAAGLWLEAVAGRPEASPGEPVAVTLTAIDRSPFPLRLLRAELGRDGPGGFEALAGWAPPEGRDLAPGEPVSIPLEATLPRGLPLGGPWWLEEEAAGGMWQAPRPALIGRPESPPALIARFHVEAGTGRPLVYTEPVRHRSVDALHGERLRPLAVVPPVEVALDAETYLFTSPEPRPVAVEVTSAHALELAALSLEPPPGWRAEPARVPLALAPRETRRVSFLLHPPPGSTGGRGVLGASVATAAGRYTRRIVRLDYPHLPVQTLAPPARASLVRVDLAEGRPPVGYVMGAGDRVPEALRQAGYPVSLLEDQDLVPERLAAFPSVVLGVRACNTRPRLARLGGVLRDYVAAGGVLVVQYNVPAGLVSEDLGPFPFRLHQGGRVTEEDAPVRFLLPEHPLLTTPNRIGEDDFRGWVQERGLYFASSWDPRYETPLASRDTAEEWLPGGLLYARHGKGVYVYTAYAWFRQLPAGVPGAFRIFANLIAGGRRP